MTELSTQEQQFHSHLDDLPDDWDFRGVYADWLGQQGRMEEEQLQRWLRVHRRCPVRGMGRVPNAWDWWDAASSLVASEFTRARIDLARLPTDLFVDLKFDKQYHLRGRYRTRRAAEQDLLAVLQNHNWPLLSDLEDC